MSTLIKIVESAMLLLLLVIGILPFCRGDIDRTWVCFVYHKSGTELCDNTMAALSKRCSLNVFKRNVTAGQTEYVDKVFDGFSSPSNRYHLIRTGLNTTGYLNDHWRKSFASAGNRYRSILFIRDPFELIMSAYKYHSEEVPVEKWLSQTINLMGYSLDYGLPLAQARYEPLMRCMGLSIKEFVDKARTIYDNCRRATKIFDNKYSYHHMIRISRHFASLPANHANFSHLNGTALDVFLSRLPQADHNVTMYGHDLYPSIRLQMCQSLYQLEAMAVSKLYEDPKYSRSMHVEDFGLGNLTQFRKTARKMANFILDGDADWGKCSDSSYFVDVMQEAAFVDPTILSSGNATSSPRRRSPTAKMTSTQREHISQHVTTFLMPRHTQEMYKHRMRSDPVFGDYLTRLASIINQPTDPKGGRMVDRCPGLKEQVNWIEMQRLVNTPI